MDKLAKLLAAIIYVPAYMASAFSALMVVSDLLLGEDSVLSPTKVTFYFMLMVGAFIFAYFIHGAVRDKDDDVAEEPSKQEPSRG